jgi:hypothetical protein
MGGDGAGAESVSVVEPWACPTCRAAVETPFCPHCGEEPLRARHLTLHDLAHQFFTTFTRVDGKLLRSLALLIARPGELTAAYVEGRRKPYLGPLPLFLVCNAIFFAAQSMSRTNIFASSLDSHLHRQDWSGTAQALVASRLAERGITLDAYAPLFDQAAILNAKALIILMVFAFAGLLPIAFLGARRPFAAHAVFSLHLYGFLLILFSAGLMIVEASLLLGGPGLDYRPFDLVLSVVNLAVGFGYLKLATGRVYGGAGWVQVAKAAGLAVVVAALVLGYRFVIFLITLYST